MAFSWEILAPSSRDENEDVLFLRRKIIDLSNEIRCFLLSVEKTGNAVASVESAPYTKADYESLAASLEKLARLFETLHRYGDFGNRATP